MRVWPGPGPIIHLLLMLLRLTVSRVLASKGRDKIPFFLQRPTSVKFYRGDTAVLVCGIENLGTRTVIWRRASEPNPLTIGSDVYVEDNRYSASGNPADKEWLLIISNVQPSDAGVYECQISSKRKLIHHILLSVNETSNPERKNYVSYKKDKHPVKNPDISVTGPKFVEKGDSIHLVCNSTGSFSSPLDLDWFKDGVKLLPDGLRHIKVDKYRVARTLVSVLDIRHSRMDDAGTYVCRSSDMSITSTKVHVLNAGSTNVRRETLATDQTQKDEESNDVKDLNQNHQRQEQQSKSKTPNAASQLSLGWTSRSKCRVDSVMRLLCFVLLTLKTNYVNR